MGPYTAMISLNSRTVTLLLSKPFTKKCINNRNLIISLECLPLIFLLLCLLGHFFKYLKCVRCKLSNILGLELRQRKYSHQNIKRNISLSLSISTHAKLVDVLAVVISGLYKSFK